MTPPDSARLGRCAPPPWVPPSLAAPTPSPLTRRVLESRRAGTRTARPDGGGHIGGIGELTHTDRYCRTTLTKPDYLRGCALIHAGWGVEEGGGRCDSA